MFSLLISLLLSVVSSQLMYKVYKTSWVFMLYVQLVYKAFWNLSFLWLNSWPYLDNYKHKGKRWQPGWVRNKLTGHYITTCCPFWSTRTWQHQFFAYKSVWCGLLLLDPICFKVGHVHAEMLFCTSLSSRFLFLSTCLSCVMWLFNIWIKQLNTYLLKWPVNVFYLG